MINCPKHGITYDDCCQSCLAEISLTAMSNKFVSQGWRCPVCGKVYSPMQPACFEDHSFKVKEQGK